MFGLGWMEIALLVVVLVLVFGPGRAGNLLGQAFGAIKKVDRAKQQVRDSVNPLNYLKPDEAGKPTPAEKETGNTREP